MQLVKISSFEPSLRNFRPGGIFDSPAVASGVLFRGLGSFVVRKVLFFRSGFGFRLRLRLGLGFGFVLRLLTGKLGLRGFQLLTQAVDAAERLGDALTQRVILGVIRLFIRDVVLVVDLTKLRVAAADLVLLRQNCLLYTSDAADD